MPTHWTYADYEPDADLAQGDILARTERLVRLLAEVHAHFCDAKYLGFLVVTQSCDLVRRSRSCAANYIALAVVRSLRAVVPVLLEEVCGTGVTGLYASEQKYRAKQLLERILNQNEQALGLFYLHPDADAGIAVESVALLRVTISLRSEHYDLLQGARVGRVKPEYASKLGWLLGNLYSRIATPDWADQPGGKRNCAEIVNRLLEHEWVSQGWLAAARREKLDLTALNPKDAIDLLRRYAPKPPKSRAIDRVTSIARDLLGEEQREVLERLARRLENDQAFSGTFKR